MNSLLPFLIRVILGGLFLISGIAKTLDPVRFLFTLRAFRLFPGIIEPWLALFLPWFEVVLGLFMVLGFFLRTCSLLLGILNFTFMAAILSVMVRGIEIDCGCFGLLADILHLPDMADYKAVVRNLVFIGMCAYLYRAEGAFLTLDRLLLHRRGGRDSA